MLNPRLLVVFSALPDGETALCMALEALSHARKPFSLRFALPVCFQPLIAAAALPAGALGEGDVKYYQEAASLADVAKQITDETHFLSLRGEYAFEDGWEGVLLSRFAKCPGKRALMTAMLCVEEGETQAYLPAFRGAINFDSATIDAGLALVASSAPVKTLVVNPAFVFGEIDFLRTTATDFDTLSIAAYAAGYAVYALDRAPLRPVGGAAVTARLMKPSHALLPPPSLSRFEQLAGFRFAQGTATVRTGLGLFGVTDGYAQRYPRRLAFRQRMRQLLRPAVPPLTVTAFVDLPGAAHPVQNYLLRFSYLKALVHLPLLLYTGGEAERRLRADFPNTLAYPDNALLPRSLLAGGMTPIQLFERNQFLLLQHARLANPSYAYIAWLDIDALPHPICPQATPDFTALMDDRVHIGWVGNEPDLSLIVAPSRLMQPLTQEVKAITQLDADMKRSFAKRQLIRRLMRRYPDLFTLHVLPRKGLLFLSCFPGELLSAPLKKLLADLPPPVRIVPSVPGKKERITHA
ncbi:MAG: hypothetical protein LLF96_05835 [Eubacteriales bacterium]|nr:hypothetical protein [Eubacteriales bacterium]